MRKIFRREEPVTHEGREISLPYTGEGAAGVGKPLKSILHMNPDIPIYLGTGNETTVKLTAEIADGWLPMGFVPGSLPEYLPWLEEGFRRAGNGKSLRDFAIQASVHVAIDNDVKAALAKLKPEVALYVGGMGHRDKNFHKDMMIRRGFGDAAERIQELYLAHRKEEAIEAVPDEWVDMKSLVGPPDAHQAALPRVGGFRRDQSDRALAPTRSDRDHGTGCTAELEGGTTMRFKDKVALITAVGSGIGRATADIMASEGAVIIGVDNDERRLAMAMEAMNMSGGRAIGRLPMHSMRRKSMTLLPGPQSNTAPSISW